MIKSFKEFSSMNESESLIIKKVVTNLDNLNLKEKMQLIWDEISKNSDNFYELWEDALNDYNGEELWSTFKSLNNSNMSDEWWSTFNTFQAYLLPVKQGGDYQKQNRFFLVADLFNLTDEFYDNTYSPDELSDKAKQFLIKYNEYIGIPHFDKVSNYKGWLNNK